MRYKLTILLFFISVVASAQSPKLVGWKWENGKIQFTGLVKIDSLYGDLEVSTDTAGRFVMMKDATTGKTYQGPRMGNVGGGGVGGGTPGGSEDEIQLNRSSAFATQTGYKINSSGEVLFNTTDKGSHKLQVEGNFFLGNSTGAATATPEMINMGGTVADAFGVTTKLKLQLFNNGTAITGLGVANDGAARVLDYMVDGASGRHSFYVDGTATVHISSAGLNLPVSGAVLNFNSGNATITHSAGLLTSNVSIVVPGEAYDATGWNADNGVATKNDIRDQIELLQTLANLSTDVGLGASNTLYPSQLAVKTYVDNTASTIALKDAVIAATSVAGTLATSFENGDAIDGVTLATGDRILIKNQAAPAENGIYTVNASGAPTRATDFDVAGEIPVGAEMFVQSGTANSGKKYTQTLVVTTLNTDPISFVLTGGASGTSWGAISGTLADQTDLQTALDGKQAADADLTTYAGITPSANIQSLLGSADYSAMRTNLSLVVGTNVQAFDADLTTYAGITPSANVQTLLGAADFAAFKTSLSLDNVDNTSNATERAATRTLTNARVTPRTGTEASSATPTINTDDVDFYSITALTVAITSVTTNLSGTPTIGQKLRIDITGTAARAITWGASFADGPVVLPTTTITTNTMKVLVEWDGSIWRCMAAGSN